MEEVFFPGKSGDEFDQFLFTYDTPRTNPRTEEEKVRETSISDTDLAKILHDNFEDRRVNLVLELYPGSDSPNVAQETAKHIVQALPQTPFQTRGTFDNFVDAQISTTIVDMKQLSQKDKIEYSGETVTKRGPTGNIFVRVVNACISIKGHCSIATYNRFIKDALHDAIENGDKYFNEVKQVDGNNLNIFSCDKVWNSNENN